MIKDNMGTAEEKETTTEEVETNLNAETEETHEGAEVTTETEELPTWMQEEDDHTSSDSMPVASHLKAKAKLKGRIQEKDGEIEELRKQIAEMQSQGSTQTLASTLTRPKRDDFDSEDEFDEALIAFIDQKQEEKNKQVSQQHDARKIAQAVENEVEQHYSRADKLITENGINPETYKNADMVVRQAVDAVTGGGGEWVVDQFIAKLGEGSEKAFYYLGRNKAALTEFTSLLAEDPNGHKAAVFLGRTMEKVKGTVKKQSNAKPPATIVEGDAPVDNADVKTWKKRYDKAYKEQGLTGAYPLKQQARSAGIDTTGW